MSGRFDSSRCGWVAVLCLVVAATLGCGRGTEIHDLGSHQDLAFLKGLVLGDHQVLALPAGRWGGNGEGSKWVFRGSATMYCLVRQQLDVDLSFHFTPDDLTTEFWFMVRWDGEPILDEPHRPGLGENTIVIPARLVTPGIHEMTVERVDRLTPDDLRDEKNNRFTRITYSLGERRTNLDLGQIKAYRYMAMLASRGVTGVSPQKMAGCLFDGPRTATSELQLHGAGRLWFLVENNSEAPARFTLGVDEASVTKTVSSEERTAIELQVEPGDHAIRMTVDGLADGLYLWGSPQIRGRETPASTPIVVVTMDTTRVDALSPWGGPAAASPEIQKLAGHSTVFENAWAVAPWTLPSHATIFTGLYPYRHGAGVSEDHLPGSIETLAERLGHEGYFAAGFAGGALSAAHFGVAQGFDLYLDPDGFETKGDALIDAVETMLDDDPPGPLFLFVNFFDPHAVYEAPLDYEALFDVKDLRKDLGDDPLWQELSDGSIDAWGRLITGEGTATPATIAYLRAAYLAEVAFMDAQIGRLVSLLEARGLFDGALFILVSDHGELLGEGGFFSHCCRLDPELVDIPLLVKWPHQKEAARVSELVSQVDLYGTVLEAAGIESPPRDGLPLGDGSEAGLQQRREVFMEEHESRIHPLFANMMLARHMYGIQELDRREVVWDGGSECESRVAGGWENDPCEVVWNDRMEWLQTLAELPLDRGVSEHSGGLSDEERERLEALGYVR